MMLPIVSATLTIARAMRGLTHQEVADLAGVYLFDVFDAETFLEEADPVSVVLIAMALDVDLTKLSDVH